MKQERTTKMTRRSALKASAGLALGSTLGAVSDTRAGSDSRKSSVYEALGVKHVINATGTVTTLGGSLMPPEVVAAWAEASLHFVDLFDLQNKVGARIAQLIGVESAM